MRLCNAHRDLCFFSCPVEWDPTENLLKLDPQAWDDTELIKIFDAQVKDYMNYGDRRRPKSQHPGRGRKAVEEPEKSQEEQDEEEEVVNHLCASAVNFDISVSFSDHIEIARREIVVEGKFCRVCDRLLLLTYRMAKHLFMISFSCLTPHASRLRTRTRTRSLMKKTTLSILMTLTPMPRQTLTMTVPHRYSAEKSLFMMDYTITTIIC